MEQIDGNDENANEYIPHDRIVGENVIKNSELLSPLTRKKTLGNSIHFEENQKVSLKNNASLFNLKKMESIPETPLGEDDVEDSKQVVPTPIISEREKMNHE